MSDELVAGDSSGHCPGTDGIPARLLERASDVFQGTAGGGCGRFPGFYRYGAFCDGPGDHRCLLGRDLEASQGPFQVPVQRRNRLCLQDPGVADSRRPGGFSPERSGSIPMLEMLELCYSGEHTKMQMHKMIRGQGGMFAHLGTSNCQEIEKRIEDGDELAKKVFEAQAYQIAKTIGLLSIVLKGDCDAIILTGGLAHSKALTKLISEYVEFIAPVIIMPGENEMQALAQGGLRLLDSKEQIHEYFYPKEDI